MVSSSYGWRNGNGADNHTLTSEKHNLGCEKTFKKKQSTAQALYAESVCIVSNIYGTHLICSLSAEI